MQIFKLIILQAVATILIAFKYCHSIAPSNPVKSIKTTPPETASAAATATTTELASTIVATSELSKQQTTKTLNTISKQLDYDTRLKGNQTHDLLIKGKSSENQQQQNRKTNDCEYEKGAWEKCKSNGKFHCD